MLTANEALELTKASNFEKCFKSIENTIKLSASEGQYSFNYEGFLNAYSVETLRSLGYIVDECHNLVTGEPFYCIAWKPYYRSEKYCGAEMSEEQEYEEN